MLPSIKSLQQLEQIHPKPKLKLTKRKSLANLLTLDDTIKKHKYVFKEDVIPPPISLIQRHVYFQAPVIKACVQQKREPKIHRRGYSHGGKLGGYAGSFLTGLNSQDSLASVHHRGGSLGGNLGSYDGSQFSRVGSVDQLEPYKKAFMDTIQQKYRDSVVLQPQALLMEDYMKSKFFWEKKKGLGNKPGARYGASLHRVGNDLYLFGGQCMKMYNDMYMYYPLSQTWNKLPAQENVCGEPEERAGHASAVWEDKIIIWGGSSNFNRHSKCRQCYGFLHIFDTKTMLWKMEMPRGFQPVLRRNHSMVVIGSTMMIYGGCDGPGSLLNDTFCLDLRHLIWFTPEWQKGSQFPPALEQFSLTPVYPKVTTFGTKKGDRSGLYLFGGADRNRVASSDLWFLKVSQNYKNMGGNPYMTVSSIIKNKKIAPVHRQISKDFKSNQFGEILEWTLVETKGKTPKGRFGHCAAWLEPYLIIFPGRNDQRNKGDFKAIANSISLFNIRTQSWEEVRLFGHEPVPRWGASCAVYDNKIFYFGGMNLERFQEAKLYALVTDANSVKRLKARQKFKEQERMKKLAANHAKGLLLISKKSQNDKSESFISTTPSPDLKPPIGPTLVPRMSLRFAPDS